MEDELRPSWDQVWESVTQKIAERSVDSRLKVGAIVVTCDNTQVLAVGYNGNYAGGPNQSESIEPGQSGLLHAEINALLKLDYNNPKEKKIYVTHFPCRMCAKAIVNSGIGHVIYSQDYRDMTSGDIFRDAGVSVRKL
jgi:dCMP deaminase